MKINIQELEKAYKQAEKDGKETFEFQGNILLTQYAKYLLEYLNDYAPIHQKSMESLMKGGVA